MKVPVLTRFLAATLGACFLVCAGLPGQAGARDRAEVLNTREQSIVAIAAFTAKGDVERLKRALEAGLNCGMTVNEEREILIQMYAYTGFPRSLTALNTLIALLDERKARGIEDNVGREATPLPAGADIRKVGTANQTAIVGRPVSGRVFEFAPAIDTYLKEHLFGDIFARDLLSFRERELATVSALASLPAPDQLRSHLNCCLVVGWTAEELHGFVNVLSVQVGKEEAGLAGHELGRVLEARARADAGQPAGKESR